MKFEIGQFVKIRKNDNADIEQYSGMIGQIKRITSRPHPYYIDFGDDETDYFSEDEITSDIEIQATIK